MVGAAARESKCLANPRRKYKHAEAPKYISSPLPNTSNELRSLVRRQVIDLMQYYILCMRTSPVLQGAGTERTGRRREKTGQINIFTQRDQEK